MGCVVSTPPSARSQRCECRFLGVWVSYQRAPLLPRTERKKTSVTSQFVPIARRAMVHAAGNIRKIINSTRRQLFGSGINIEVSMQSHLGPAPVACGAVTQ